MYRHLALYRRSWPRLLELMYWPVLQMLVWGFVTAWLAGVQNNTASVTAGVLLGGVLLWEVTLRSQMGFAISFLEEIWSRNLGHIFVAPLRPYELVAGLVAMSILRTAIGVGPAILLAFLLYGFGIWTLGPVLVLYFTALMAMGWAVALGVTALILRHGAGAEALAWGVLFGLAPFSAVFYPVSVLPGWLQPISLAIPATHVFEGMRAALLNGQLAWDHLAYAFALDLIWLGLAAWLFMAQFQAARVRGALMNIGE
jgi:ABC-2 type transport system permease protein